MGLNLLLLTILGVSLIEARRSGSNYTYFRNAGWFKLHTELVDWTAAKEICQSEGSNITTIPIMNNKDIVDAMRIIMNITQTNSIQTDLEKPMQEDLYTDNAFKSIAHKFIMKREYNEFEQVPKEALYPVICHKQSKVDTDRVARICDKLGTSQHSCYEFHSIPSTWNAARNTCKAKGFDLVVIDSHAESRLVADLITIAGYSNERIFIGVSMPLNEDWTTINGQQLYKSGYEEWMPGEPNNKAGNEFCISARVIDQKLLFLDDPCERVAPFICELLE